MIYHGHLTHPDIWTMWFSLFVAIGVCADWFLRAWDYWYVTLVDDWKFRFTSVYPQWYYKRGYVQVGRIQIEIFWKSFRIRRPQ